MQGVWQLSPSIEGNGTKMRAGFASIAGAVSVGRGSFGVNGRGWAVRIFPIRTVSLLIRFGVDPVRPILANQVSGLPALQGSGTSFRKVQALVLRFWPLYGSRLRGDVDTDTTAFVKGQELNVSCQVYVILEGKLVYNMKLEKAA